MPDPLSMATARWQTLLDAHEDALALTVFCDEIIPLLLPELHARFDRDYPEEQSGGTFGGLVSLLGYTPDTTILAAQFVEAKVVVVLHTLETRPFLDQVRAMLPQCDVKSVQFDRDDLGSLEPAMGTALQALDDSDDVVVEMTGGTKPMGNLVWLAAAMRGIPALYIDYLRYDPRHRKPVPASIYMRLMRAPRPSALSPLVRQDLVTRLQHVTSSLRDLAPGPVSEADLQRNNRIQIISKEIEQISSIIGRS